MQLAAKNIPVVNLTNLKIGAADALYCSACNEHGYRGSMMSFTYSVAAFNAVERLLRRAACHLMEVKCLLLLVHSLSALNAHAKQVHGQQQSSHCSLYQNQQPNCLRQAAAVEFTSKRSHSGRPRSISWCCVVLNPLASGWYIHMTISNWHVAHGMPGFMMIVSSCHEDSL